jgi:GntR family transcriptional repressor for pyruvate dehydrogenase complex
MANALDAQSRPSQEGSGAVARPLKVTSLVTQVATLIEEQCIASRLSPGDVLPAEGQIAEEFGVSRVVVREAMKVIEARGLIRRQQGKRAVIEAPNARPIEDFATRSAQMDKHNVLELTEVRKALEVHGARLAAYKFAEQDSAVAADQIPRARALIKEMRQCLPEPADRAVLDVQFHHVLADMSGNVILAQMLGALDRPLHDSREQNHRASLDSGAPRGLWADEHAEVLDAIVSGDPPRAVRAMEEHLDLSLREVASRPESNGNRPEGAKSDAESMGR